MSSIYDVARSCGLSTATVSRALRGLPNVSPATRDRVRAAAVSLGYVPSPTAAGLSSGRHHAIAVVIPSMGRWFYTEVVEGVGALLRRRGYDMFLVDLNAGLRHRDSVFPNSRLHKRADAIIALGIDFTPDERRQLRSLAMPAVVVGGPVAGVPSVGIDDAAATHLAMDHLLDLGHTRIAHIGGEDEFGMDHTVALIRHREWRRALIKRGLDVPGWWFGSGGFVMPQGKVVARAMLNRPDRPTAIFAGSDEMAFGAVLAARELGIRVPEDLSVIGIDDHSWSQAFDLTTIRQDPCAQGERAARLVVDQLAGAADPGTAPHVAPIELLLRGSTAPVPLPETGLTADRSTRSR
ncbi:LacI family DNA-binding transcriptional regulator [Amnibacterium sp. CER49]|uniref:LacI family DNA-binding transcriptional regulator n=1 Tax=Amnibacterium sp. CER49 TaxID=3039161 RepID=UPI00244C5991|nr:LacI family DNA-binding transcriptional regulator [Amnibacterium sp. CER49]MDH2443267.1 LacI family DNA-binding transcriptional regulator [Amnibacterium sp. CER49]